MVCNDTDSWLRCRMLLLLFDYFLLLLLLLLLLCKNFNIDCYFIVQSRMDGDTPPPDTPPPPELPPLTPNREDVTRQVADSQVTVRGV